jgi:hypothetical protein
LSSDIVEVFDDLSLIASHPIVNICLYMRQPSRSSPHWSSALLGLSPAAAVIRTPSAPATRHENLTRAGLAWVDGGSDARK